MEISFTHPSWVCHTQLLFIFMNKPFLRWNFWPPQSYVPCCFEGCITKTPGTSETLRTTSNPKSSLQRCVHRLCRFATAAAMWHGVEIRWYFPTVDWYVLVPHRIHPWSFLEPYWGDSIDRNLHRHVQLPNLEFVVHSGHLDSLVVGCIFSVQNAFFRKMRVDFQANLLVHCVLTVLESLRLSRTNFFESDCLRWMCHECWYQHATDPWYLIFLIDLCLTVQSRKTPRQLYRSHSTVTVERSHGLNKRCHCILFSYTCTREAGGLLRRVRKRCRNWAAFFLNDQPHVLEGTPYTAA